MLRSNSAGSLLDFGISFHSVRADLAALVELSEKEKVRIISPVSEN